MLLFFGNILDASNFLFCLDSLQVLRELLLGGGWESVGGGSLLRRGESLKENIGPVG